MGSKLIDALRRAQSGTGITVIPPEMIVQICQIGELLMIETRDYVLLRNTIPQILQRAEESGAIERVGGTTGIDLRWIPTQIKKYMINPLTYVGLRKG